MYRKIGIVGCLMILGVTGCASPTRLSIGNVRLGMSPDQVLAVVGEPAAKDERQHLQAWRYEYLNYLSQQGELDCDGSGRHGSAAPCRSYCEHTTVWFNNNNVRSMTLYAVDGMEGCGTGSTPIIWEHMPEHVDGSGE